MPSNLAINAATKVNTTVPKTEQKVENNNAEKSKYQFSDKEIVIGGLSALVILGTCIYAAVKRGQIKGKKFAKFDAGKAFSNNGKPYTGTYTRENKNGTKLVAEYKDGLLQTAKKYRGEEVIYTKTYKYDENNRIKSVTKNGIEMEYTRDNDGKLIKSYNKNTGYSRKFFYDKNGKLIKKSYIYDKNNRIALILKGKDKIEFTRDTDGKLIKVYRKINNEWSEIKFFYDENGKIFRTKIECAGDNIYKEFYKGTNKVHYKYCRATVNDKYALHVYDEEGKEVRILLEPRFINHEGYHSIDDKVSGDIIEDGKWHSFTDSGEFKENKGPWDYHRRFSVNLNNGTKDSVWVSIGKTVNLLSSGKRRLNPSKVFTTVEHPGYGSFDIVYDSGTKKIDFLNQKEKPDSEEVAKIIIDKAKSNFQQAYEFVRKLPQYAKEYNNDFMTNFVRAN